MKYIIDSNCFVTPHRSFCPTDVGVSFWSKLRTLAEDGKICSIDKVQDELYSNSDELKNWMETSLNDSFFVKFDNAMSVQKLTAIVQWAATNTFYIPKAKTKFLCMDKADIYLASFASSRFSHSETAYPSVFRLKANLKSKRYCIQPFSALWKHLPHRIRSVNQRRITEYTLPYSVCFRPTPIFVNTCANWFGLKPLNAAEFIFFNSLYISAADNCKHSSSGKAMRKQQLKTSSAGQA